jgi:hypothetical protein
MRDDEDARRTEGWIDDHGTRKPTERVEQHATERNGMDETNDWLEEGNG